MRKEPTPEPTAAEISRVMAAMGRKGGKIGGKNRMQSLGAHGRSVLGRKAITARWEKYRAKRNAKIASSPVRSH
jgi:hypothetical protein